MIKIKKKLLNSMIVSFNITTNEALKKLERAHKKILFITNKKKLIGVIEDSDIRRALIKKKNYQGRF